MYFPRCTNPVGIFPDKKHKINPILVPCGKCTACKISKSSEWSMRSLMEFHSCGRKAAFLTLTYDDEHYTPFLDKRDLQLFFKSFRKAISPLKFRYFACGEYGDCTYRPHFHVLIFGFDVDDFLPLTSHKQFLSNGFRGDFLPWHKGFIHVGSVNEKSCQYVAKYCLKSIKKSNFSPFQVMSRRPALGDYYMRSHYRRILDGNDPIIRFTVLDECATPHLPRFVRERCELYERLFSDDGITMLERQEQRKDFRLAYAQRQLVTKFPDLHKELLDRAIFEENCQRDLNLRSGVNKRGSL